MAGSQVAWTPSVTILVSVSWDKTLRRRIQVNPNQGRIPSKAQTQKPQGRTHGLKEKLETLKAFLSKGVNRSSSLYKIHNEVIGSVSYQWNGEAETSFQRWKKCMEIFPEVVPPVRGEILSLHIAASSDEIGAMLFGEKGSIQIPIYFVSRTLPNVERGYAGSDKLILALVHATRRLRRYFKDHPVKVLTDEPVERVLLNPGRSRRAVKWARELEEYDIIYGEDDLFKNQQDEPPEACESNMSSNRKLPQAKREGSHHLDDSRTRVTPHIQENSEGLDSGTEQQASTK
ncbi:reverse transcriptase domain, Ribonuclease H-like domain protein [Artemisia annua]|uniref:Reverse transcriptase domain, Ribonuclease H-like domain protein n=1 Tax=Artemisia annua TaxID=35608 RepID=A0A2U1Q0Q8_ARTAN|nr:reverse transcriptase domain, Ribonuclease H-like domain protein [Artemisia annua]